VPSSDILKLVVPVFAVGLGSGYLMVKTNSLWGAVLFHAGADICWALGFTMFSVR
jgi:hypothetical protein